MTSFFFDNLMGMFENNFTSKTLICCERIKYFIWGITSVRESNSFPKDAGLCRIHLIQEHWGFCLIPRG